MDFPLLRSQNQIFSSSQILLLCLLVELCEISEVRVHFLFFFLLSSGLALQLQIMTGYQRTYNSLKAEPVDCGLGKPKQ